MKIPAIFELTDISKGKLDESISILIPANKAPKHEPVIKPLKDWIKELKGDKNEFYFITHQEIQGITQSDK